MAAVATAERLSHSGRSKRHKSVDVRHDRSHTTTMSVFISHALEDQEWARELMSRLSESGIEVWDPASQVFPGDNWALKIGQALEKSNAMVVLLSPAAAKSEPVQRDVQYALGSKRFKNRLIPVMIKSTTRFPWILKDCLLYTSPSPRDLSTSRMPSSA